MIVSNEEREALKNNKGILADAPPQWPKFKLNAYIAESLFDASTLSTLSKEDLLTLCGQLHRYGGKYYMGIARDVRAYLYAHFTLSPNIIIEGDRGEDATQ